MIRRKKRRPNALNLMIKDLKGLYGRGYLDFFDPTAVANHLRELRNPKSKYTASSKTMLEPLRSAKPQGNGGDCRKMCYVSMYDVPRLVTARDTKAAIEERNKPTQPKRPSMFFVHASEPVGRETFTMKTGNSSFSSRSSTVTSVTGGCDEVGESSQYFATPTKCERVPLPHILARIEKKEQERKVGEALRKKFNLKCKSSVQSEWVTRKSGASGSNHYYGADARKSSVRDIMSAITGVGSDEYLTTNDSPLNSKDTMYATDETSSVYFDDNNSSNKHCVPHEDKNVPTSTYFHDFGGHSKTPFLRENNNIYESSIFSSECNSSVPSAPKHNEYLKEGNFTCVDPISNPSQRTSPLQWKTKRGSFFDDCWKDSSSFILQADESPGINPFPAEREKPFLFGAEGTGTAERPDVHGFLNDSGVNFDFNFSDENSQHASIIPHDTFSTPPSSTRLSPYPDSFCSHSKGYHYDEPLVFSLDHDNDNNIFTQNDELEQDFSSVFSVKHNDRFVP